MLVRDWRIMASQRTSIPFKTQTIEAWRPARKRPTQLPLTHMPGTAAVWKSCGLPNLVRPSWPLLTFHTADKLSEHVQTLHCIKRKKYVVAGIVWLLNTNYNLWCCRVLHKHIADLAGWLISFTVQWFQHYATCMSCVVNVVHWLMKPRLYGRAWVLVA